jgi:hypothetical protein
MLQPPLSLPFIMRHHGWPPTICAQPAPLSTLTCWTLTVSLATLGSLILSTFILASYEAAALATLTSWHRTGRRGGGGLRAAAPECGQCCGEEGEGEQWRVRGGSARTRGMPPIVSWKLLME